MIDSTSDCLQHLVDLHSLEILHLCVCVFFIVPFVFFVCVLLVPFSRQANISSISFASNCVLIDKERTRTEKRYHSSRRDLSQSKNKRRKRLGISTFVGLTTTKQSEQRQVNGIDGELLLIDQSQHMQ